MLRKYNLKYVSFKNFKKKEKYNEKKMYRKMSEV